MSVSKPILVLMGMKHCGKTTLGQHVSKALSLPFEDLDDRVSRIYTQRTGTYMPIREIFRTLGKSGFQELEVEGINQLIEVFGITSQNPVCILALGGGTIENPSALSVLDPFGYFIYLEETEEILLDRILRGGIPSFLNEEDPKGDFHRLYEHRTALYRTAANWILTTTGKTIDDLVQELVHHLHAGALNERK
ncbi:MAG: shikimate kinase [Spirochaetes bacterium]|nr:shikimate kinase [Spirochaetota bacterium]